VRPDSASDLVGAYLRVNGYFVITDLEIHVTEKGQFRTVTDVDIVAIRPPSLSGPHHYRGVEGAAECVLTGDVDPALGVHVDRFDVIIGEVKRGDAALNPGLWDPRVLHAVMRRIGDVFGAEAVDIIDAVIATGRASTPDSQVRLVAFAGRGAVSAALTIHHDHMVDWLNRVLVQHRELFEITVHSDPVLSLLALASRVGRPLAGAMDNEVDDEES
jgi:hypothetical protein